MTTPENYSYYGDDVSGWTGWIYFASTMMIVGGTLSAMYGLVAVINDDWVVFNNTGALFVDVSNWGWVHMVLGVVLLLSAIGVMTGNILARTVGVIMASLHILINFALMPLYPLWSLTIITISLLIVWALTVHGRELKGT